MSSLKSFLTCHGDTSFDGNFRGLLNFEVPRDIALDMVEEVTSEEIKRTFFDMDSNKALGLDGFGTFFFSKKLGILWVRMWLIPSNFSFLWDLFFLRSITLLSLLCLNVKTL